MENSETLEIQEEPQGEVREISGMFEGKIGPLLFKLALPIALSGLVNQVIIIVDSIFISSINKGSTAYLSGAGVVFPLMFIYLALGFGLATGVSTLLARGIGEKSESAIKYTSDSGFLITAIIAVITFIFGYVFAKPIIRLLAGSQLSEAALKNSLDYYNFILPSFVLMLFSFALQGILRGEGLMKHIAIGGVVGTVVNLILDPIFIFTLNLGVSGAAIASTLAQLTGVIYLLIIILGGKRVTIPISWNIFKAKIENIKGIIIYGFPEIVGFLTTTISLIFLNKLFGSIGEAEMNGWIICGRTDTLMILPTFGIGAAMMMIAGQNYGRNKLDRLKDIFKTTIIASIVVFLVLAIIYNIVVPFLFSLYTDIDKVLIQAITQVRILSISFLGIVIAIISTSFLIVIGKLRSALIIRVIQMDLLWVPVCFLIVYVFNLGVMAIFVTLFVGRMLLIAIALLWTSNAIKKLKFKSVLNN